MQKIFHFALHYPNKALALVLVLLFVSLLGLFLNVRFGRYAAQRKMLVNGLIGFLAMLGFIALLLLINQRVSKKQKGPRNWANRVENTHIHTGHPYVFGIDVSHYNGAINWPKVTQSKHPIKFVFVRATMGRNGIDNRYAYNLQEAADAGFLVGSYHYFRPNEPADEQFLNFKQHAMVKPGHLHPMLDIEAPSRQGNAHLIAELKKWLKLAEAAYGVKPIIYTGRNFYETRLKGHVEGYPLWIASYSHKEKLQRIDWTFHQFSERVIVQGIPAYVDGNDFKGDLSKLQRSYVMQR
jgi:lysozyme